MSLRGLSECTHFIVNSSSTPIVVAAAVLTQRVYVYRLILVVGGASVLTLQDTGANAVSGPLSLAVNGSIVLDVPNNNESWWNTNTGFGLQIAFTNAVTIGGDIWFMQGQ